MFMFMFMFMFMLMFMFMFMFIHFKIPTYNRLYKYILKINIEREREDVKQTKRYYNVGEDLYAIIS